MRSLGDRYTLLDRLGSGAMGVVWRARDELLHREVAIKQLLLPDLNGAQVEEACRRALREGRIAAKLHHPHAVGVHDVVIEDGKPCLVMEYVPSTSLSELLAERGTLPPAEAAWIGAKVAAALAAAHAAGIVHRDVKPGNVLIGHDGTVKLSDFGISRASGDDAVTRTGTLAGTLAYLAPEVARGGEATAASDVFSLGATLYAMTEGQPPFGRVENDFGLLYKISTGEVTPPARSGPLTPLLTRLLANDPAARPTAAQVAAELAGGEQAPRQRRGAVVVAAAVLVGVVAAVVTASFLVDGDQKAGAGPTTSQSAKVKQANFTTKQANAFIKDYFAGLPNDEQRWRPYEVVAIYGEPVASTSGEEDRFAVEVDVTLRKRGAAKKDVSIERFRFDLVVKNGALVIAHSRRVSP